jgi:hypothetical protein
MLLNEDSSWFSSFSPSKCRIRAMAYSTSTQAHLRDVRSGSFSSILCSIFVEFEVDVRLKRLVIVIIIPFWITFRASTFKFISEQLILKYVKRKIGVTAKFQYHHGICLGRQRKTSIRIVPWSNFEAHISRIPSRNDNNSTVTSEQTFYSFPHYFWGYLGILPRNSVREFSNSLLTYSFGIWTDCLPSLYLEFYRYSSCSWIPSYFIWCYTQKERDHYEDQDIGGWTILKWILER